MKDHSTEVSHYSRCTVSDEEGKKDWFFPYKDLVAKSAKEAAEPKRVEPSKCGLWFCQAICGSGDHQFAKKLLCNQEWCETCGKNDSAAHKRRQARMIPKIQQLKSMGQIIIEFPELYRKVGERGLYPDLDGGELVKGWCYSKPDLRDTTDIVVNVLAGTRSGAHRARVGGFFARGTLRWHWFGEVCVHSHSQQGRQGLMCEHTGERCPKRKCDKFVNNGKWNPHIGVLVDGGHLTKGELAELKKALRDGLGVNELIVNYSYTKKPGKMVHAVRYTTRPTFKERFWNPYMASELYNFRNVRWWGKWNDEPAWEIRQAEAEGEDVNGLEAVSKLQENICPDCGSSLAVRDYKKKLNPKTGDYEFVYDRETGKPVPVYWSNAFPSLFLDMWGAQEIGKTGYYRLVNGGLSLPENGLVKYEPSCERKLYRVEAKCEPIPLEKLRATNRKLIRRLREEAKKRKDVALEDG